MSDFFARVVLDETGRLNLQDVARTGIGRERAGGSGASSAPDVATAMVAAPAATAGPAAIVRFRPDHRR